MTSILDIEFSSDDSEYEEKSKSVGDEEGVRTNPRRYVNCNAGLNEI